MERVSEIRLVKRSFWGELSYRSNWFVFGLIACILLAFIPIVGWFMAAGVFLAMVWKTLGLREKQKVGDCPVCTQTLLIEPKVEGIDCPVCQSYVEISDNRLIVDD
ncbi:hypothetical protein [Pseudomonas sp. RIT357]|uniref:hypothetical protein n=1 Tax=Pseudomonas sp. RIT357 TaxID=1470593 RepID=UPI000452D544|nr:hypothetical protein [Pseudomonas sp. RIT357]EZP64212.1 hypothetical protein BW43_04152 [Pseudomonas sp. RIT357]